MKLNHVELAWAAGFYDGEGHCHLPKNAPPTLRVVQCGQFAKALLGRFQNAVGGLGAIYGPYKTSGKDRYTWQSKTFEEVQATAAFLWNFLGPAKREQLAENLGAYKKRRTRKPPGWHLRGKRLPVHRCICGAQIRGPSFWKHKAACVVLK